MPEFPPQSEAQQPYSISPVDPSEYLKTKVETAAMTPEEEQSEAANVSEAKFVIDEEKFSDGRHVEKREHFNDVEFNYELDFLKPDQYPPNVAAYVEDVLRYEGRVLKPLVMSNLAISKDGQKLMGTEEINPNGYTILLDPNRAGGAATDATNKVISLDWFDTPSDLIGLFHEAAHNEIYESLSEEDKKKYEDITYRASMARLGRGSQYVLSSDLKIERDAWALAIKRMKPLISDEAGRGIVTRADLNTHIHKRALKHYGDKIVEKTARPTQTDN